METFRPYRFDKWLFFTTIALLTLGSVMVFSASGMLATEKYHQPFYFLINQVIGAGAGLLFIFFMTSVKKPYYQNSTVIYGLMGIALALLVLCFFMPPVAKTNRWLTILGIRFQPSELAKISLILFLAMYLEQKKDRLHDRTTLITALGVMLIFAMLILVEPDFGTAFLVLALCAILLYIGGAGLKYFITLGLAAAPIFVVFLLLSPYKIERIQAHFFPNKSPSSLKFQVAQSKLALGAGGLLGVNFGEGTQKLFFLPCPHTDFIFAVIGEELGLVGALATMALFLIILWRGIVISLRAPNLFCQLAASGLTFLIAIQALLNITVVLGLGPAKGVPLPLLSFGRSSLVSNLMAIGVLLHISQRKGDNRNYS